MFLAGLAGAAIFGGLATLFGATTATVITVSLIGGILCAVVSGILTKDDIENIAKSHDLDGLLEIEAARTTNRVKLTDLRKQIKLQIDAPDGIADDVHTGDFIYV